MVVDLKQKQFSSANCSWHKNLMNFKNYLIDIYLMNIFNKLFNKWIDEID
jgi:hypothetical protein